MISTTLKTFPLFQKVSDDFLDQTSRQSTILRGDKGHLLFVSQQAANSFYIIQKGWVKLFRETLDGDQAIIDILPKGHIFGESSIFESNTYPFSAEIVEPASLLSIPLALLENEIKSNPDFAMAMMASMARYSNFI